MTKPSSPKTVRAKGSASKQRAPSPIARDTGPVTLKQARTLAGAPTAFVDAETRRLTTAAARSVPVAAPAEGPSPDSIAVERRRLRMEQHEERKRRIRDYAATMKIMKSRGVKGLETLPAPSGLGGRGMPMAATTSKPLQVLAEGDSWFDYPVPLFGGGIVRRLERLLGVPILNMAKAGDEVRYMLGVEERKLLSAHLSDGCPAGGSWDVLLFSGGGNDIVANPMALWIRDYDPKLSPREHIHPLRFKAALALVQAGYEDLIAIRNLLSPTTHLFFHVYDFALPDGRGICHLGPWLKPTFDLRGFPSTDVAAYVVRAMLEQFSAIVHTLHQPGKGVTVINTQGTLVPQSSSWHNELHPAKTGFNQFAQMFHAELKTRFPANVL